MSVQMQARSSSNGQLYTWVTGAPDWAASGFPGPGPAVDVALALRPALQGTEGNVTGAVSAALNRLAAFADGTGKNLKDSGVLVAALETNILRYGACGTADDSAVLIAALAAVPAGGKVIIPGGTTVTIDNITVTDRVICGEGKLRWKAASTNPMLTLVGRAKVQDLEFDGQSANHGTTVAVVTSSAPRSQLVNCYVHDFRYKFFLTDVGNSPRGKFERCWFYNCGQVIDCDIVGIRSSFWSIVNCDFEHVTAAGHMVRIGQYSVGTVTPVVGTRIVGCSFVDSVEVGVVCELYTQGIEIVGNDFRDLDQGVKIESTLGSQFGVNVIDNEFRNIALDTAFNWGVAGTYSQNRCYDCGGGFIFAQGAICEGNYLDNCGDGVQACIAVFSGSTGKYIIRGNEIKNALKSGIDIVVANAIVEGNHIERAAGAALVDGIVLRGGTSSARGNVVKNTGGFGIRVFGAQNIVEGNVIDGATTALYLESTLTNSSVTGNVMANVSSTKIAFTNNAAFETVQVKDNPGADELVYSYTIAAGVISVGRSTVQAALNTEAAAATDDLDTITATNAKIGQIIILHDNDSTHDVTVKHGTGNISLTAGADFAMLTSAYHIALQWSGTRWCEVYRATN
jgi:hypothetical protein